MHREDNSNYLLYIEPKAEDKSNEPINDEITELVQKAFANSKSGIANYSDLECNGKIDLGDGWRGFHECNGETSTSRDYLLDNGMITNSLCIHYVKYYRDVIPETEMNKINQLCKFMKEKQLT